MDEVEQTQEELKEEMNQLKEQMSKIMEMLQSMEKRRSADEAPSTVQHDQPGTPLYPPGFTPMPPRPYGLNPQGIIMPLAAYPPNLNVNPQEINATPFPPYGLPPGYTPPVATEPLDNHLPISTLNSSQLPPPPVNTKEIPQAQPSFNAPIPSTIPQEINMSTVTLVPNPQNVTQQQTLPFNTHGAPLATHSTPVYVPPFYSDKVAGARIAEDVQSKEKFQILEERLRAIEGDNYGFGDAFELCLVPDVVIPPKFKVPEFDKYRGTTCPKNHLTMYCRKMASYAHDDKLLIHFFQDSLAGAAASWYTHLERAHIRSWKDLADAFLKQYKYNIDMAPDRMQLQNMVKKESETFKEYAQRWREVVAQVQPPLSEKEVVAMFIDTLQSPFYDKMIGNVSSNFSDMVVIGERVESGMRNGKIAHVSVGTPNAKKTPMGGGKRKEGETNAVMFDQRRHAQGVSNTKPINFQHPLQTPYMHYPYLVATSHTHHHQPYQSTMPYRPPSSAQPRAPPTPPIRPPNQPWNQNPNSNLNYRRPPYNQERKPFQFDPIPMTYTELLPKLIQNSLVVPCPMKPLEPPFPRDYDLNAKCDYHVGAIGHSTENCKSLKFKVQDLINAKWLTFKENNPSVGSNPLPGHEGPSVNATEGYSDQPLVMEVENVKTPMRVIFTELCKFGMIEGDRDENEMCGMHPNAEHSIEECSEFKEVLQGMMDMQLVQISGRRSNEDVSTIQSSNGQSMTFPRPLTINFTRSAPMPCPCVPIPLTLQMPSPFPYNDSKAVLWKYDVEACVSGPEDDPLKENSGPRTSAISNLVGVGGMTRSGRVYTPEELQRNMAKNDKGKNKSKEIADEEVIKEKKEQKKAVTDEEAYEFLKFVKQSDYKVVDQLNYTPAKISILALLLSSEPHRKALMKLLNEAHVAHDITVDKFGGVIGNITATNFPYFTDDEIPLEGRRHNKALHISVKCQNHGMRKVLIDNGSSLNVMPKSTLSKLPIDGSYMKPSTMIVRAFDGKCSQVMGEIELPIQVGPYIFETTFQVMDIRAAYSCLLGRPWIHPAGVVPSTLHQMLKFVVDDKLVTVYAAEDMLVCEPSSDNYIEAAEEALEASLHSFEIVSTTYVEYPFKKPQLSKAALMMAKVMLKGRYQYGCGLGKDEEGPTRLLELGENKGRFGLGYKPTKADWRRIMEEKREKRWARLENREPKSKGVLICDIKQSFRSAGWAYVDQVAVAEDDLVANHTADLVYPCSPDTELNNWEIREFPVVFNSCSK